jgi:AsmA protein
LAAADISVNLHVSEVQHHKDSITNLVFESELKAGSLNISEYSFEGPEGTFNTSLTIQPTGANQADVNIDLSADKLVLNLSGLPEETLQDIPSMSLDFHASGKGGDIRQIAGSLNGEFYLESSGGTLVGVDLSILDTFILDEIFGLLMPKDEAEKDLDLKCAATILKIKDGLIKTDPAFAFTTDKIGVVTKGTLDLKTEKMNFNFNATPNNALQISAGELFNPYILISGTLAKPAVGLDPAKALLHGGAAIGTAGISILAKGLLDRVGNASPVCEEMLKAPPPQG